MVHDSRNSDPVRREASSPSPALAVVYVLVVAVAAFVFHDLKFLLGLALLQWGGSLLSGLGFSFLLKPLRKLSLFGVLVVGSYALVGTTADPLAIELPLWPWPLSPKGALLGCAMFLRVLAVVSASQWIRSMGAPGDFVLGLRRLGLPEVMASLLDQSLFLLEGQEEGRGGGGGGRGQGGGQGRGRGRGRGKNKKKSELQVGRLLRGDVSVLVDALQRSVERAVAAAQGRGVGRDVIILSGLLVVMMSLKFLKVMPGLPFAPGHKAVILFPIYLLAARLTQRRNGATLLGTAFGLLSFLFGDGRYGIFEILKHIAPGLVADLFAPTLRGNPKKLWLYVLAGAVMGLGRIGTIATVVLLVGAPPAVLAALSPAVLVHVGFGIASGLVTRVLMGGAEQIGHALTESESCDVRHPVEEECGTSGERERYEKNFSSRKDAPGGAGMKRENPPFA